MKIAIVPGSFDPMTKGHINIIERASTLFDKVFVAVMINSTKKYMFSCEERTEIARLSVSHLENVEVIFDDGMLADLASRLDACAIVKGIRDDKDYVYEFEMAQFNARRNPKSQTVFLPCDEGAREISSTAVRKKLECGEDISDIVSDNAIAYIVQSINR
jgi:pantetheine-phosphate adenylyltransferase